MDNFDIFDQIVGIIFAELCDLFPVGAIFEVNQVVHEVSPQGNFDEYDLKEMVESTFDFLAREGFMVERGDSRQGFREDVCLTLKGLAAVKKKPSSLGGETVGSAISSAVKEGAVDKVKSLVSDLISIKTVTVVAESLI